MAEVQQSMTDRASEDRETEECLRYWEERIRAGQRRGRELDQSLLADSSSAADRFPETPDALENGNLARDSESQNAGSARGSGFQTGQARGNLAQVEAQQEVEYEIAGLRKRRHGNLAGPLPAPGRLDDFARGRLVTLLAMGLSIRQSAAAIGLSHTAVRKQIRRNPELLAQVAAAREQARLEPLLVIIRESKRSWRAASWLMRYLDGNERKGIRRKPRNP